MFILIVSLFLTSGISVIWILRQQRQLLIAAILFPVFFASYIASFLVKTPNGLEATVLMIVFEVLFLLMGIYFILFIKGLNNDDDDNNNGGDDDEPIDPPKGPDPLWLDFEKTKPVNVV